MDAFYIERLDTPATAISSSPVGAPTTQTNVFSIGVGLALIVLAAAASLDVLAVGCFLDEQNGIANAAGSLSVFGQNLEADVLWIGLCVANILCLLLAALLIRRHSINSAAAPNHIDITPPVAEVNE